MKIAFFLSLPYKMFRLMAFANRILSVFVKVVSSNTVSNTFHKGLTLFYSTLWMQSFIICATYEKIESLHGCCYEAQTTVCIHYTHVSYIPFILKHTSENIVNMRRTFFSRFSVRFPYRLIQLVQFGWFERNRFFIYFIFSFACN